MRSISDTIRRLRALQPPMPQGRATYLDRLTDLRAFGTNPGMLRARIHIPADLPENAPLVVVLHGCTQSAAGYDQGSGWSALADLHRFAVLFPEQQRANNANLCFNWFAPEDIRRDSGEALSIRQMIETVVVAYGIDRNRISVTGLSAGGAMASAMLATYPEIFAGGAIIAGLPYGSAATMQEAFDRMRGHGCPTGAALQALLRGASSHKGPWPKISVWHGAADLTVSPSNMDRIVAQWRGVHRLDEKPTHTETSGKHGIQVWRDAKGCALIETHSIAGMGHGAPVDARSIEGGSIAAPFMLDVGISSTLEISRFWGLTPVADADENKAGPDALTREPVAAHGAAVLRPATQRTDASTKGITKVIQDALRAAGLMD